MLCRSCCLSLSPAVSLSGPGVGFGDSVLWILPWLRPKLLGPHGAAAPPDQLPAHPFIFLPTFPGTLAYTNSSSRPFPSACFSHQIYDILCRGNSLWFTIHTVLWTWLFTARLMTACRGTGVWVFWDCRGRGRGHCWQQFAGTSGSTTRTVAREAGPSSSLQTELWEAVRNIWCSQLIPLYKHTASFTVHTGFIR